VEVSRARILVIAAVVLMLSCLVALPAFADVPARVDVQPPTEVRSGNYLNFIVAVYDAEGYRVDFPVSENLIVVKDNSGKTTSFVPEARRVGTGTYQAVFTLPHTGVWTIVIAPDTPFAVVSSVTSYSSTPVRLSPTSFVAAIALAVVGVLLVVLLGARVRKARLTRKAAPNPEAHDTWWW
jgi:hypothetical protein